MKLDLPPGADLDWTATLKPVRRIDLWWQHLDVAEARFAALLSDHERRWADRFRSAVDRRRYIVRRGRLRELLAAQLNCGVRDVAITYNKFGKPRVEGCDLKFSLSHAQGMALYTFARGHEIGCDIEWHSPGFALKDTAKLCLSDRELEAMRSLPERQWVSAFLSYWTCKEAYLKARGVGFALSPRAITVAGGELPHFVELPDDDPAEWSLVVLDLPAGYVGALAVDGVVPAICYRS